MNRINNLLFVIIFLTPVSPTVAQTLMYGCLSRPACGKICKLVCETKTITVTCYGSECDEICVPGPSKRCCTYCCECSPGTACGCEISCGCTDKCIDKCIDKCTSADACCSECGACCGCQPKAKYCWTKWIPCRCAKPRTVKKLTKFEVTREVCSYHWEVVHGCRCGAGRGYCCASGCDCVYKPAPADAPIGAVFELTADDLKQLAEERAAVDRTST